MTEPGANAINGSELAPDKVQLAVLVFLDKAHGSHGGEAAEVARPIFEAYAETLRRGETEKEETERRRRQGRAGDKLALTNCRFSSSPRPHVSGSRAF